jgi:hypothetical protein
MTPKTKKVLVITISLLSLAGLSYFAYTYFKNKKDDVSGGDKDNKTSSDTPPVVTTNTGVNTVPTTTTNDAPPFDPKKADYTSGGRLKTIDDPLSRDEAKYYTRAFQEWHDGMEFPNAIRLGRDGVLGKNTKKAYKDHRTQYIAFLYSFNKGFNLNVFPQIRIARIDKYLNA